MTRSEDPIDRLRDADPARDVEPRAGFADDVIARAEAPVDLASERRKRRPGAMIGIAASIAAALAIGGAGGYAVAAGSDDGTTPVASSESASDESAQESTEFEPFSSWGAPGEHMNEAESGAESSNEAFSTADDIGFLGYDRRTFETGLSLSSARGTATEYAFDPAASSNAESMSALAAALGVQGEPAIEDGQWQVGETADGWPALNVSLDGSLSFWFDAGDDQLWECGDACDPPSGDEAIAALRDVLADLGRDPDAFEYTSDTWEGSPVTDAQARPVGGYDANGDGLGLSLSREGISNAWGSAAEIVEVGELPIVSEAEAFERLSDPRFGTEVTSYGDEAYEMREDWEEWTPPTEAPAAPAAGDPVPWHVSVSNIVSVEQGLMTIYGDREATRLVPSYEFTDADGTTWSAIAVAEDALDLG